MCLLLVLTGRSKWLRCCTELLLPFDNYLLLLWIKTLLTILAHNFSHSDAPATSYHPMGSVGLCRVSVAMETVVGRHVPHTMCVIIGSMRSSRSTVTNGYIILWMMTLHYVATYQTIGALSIAPRGNHSDPTQCNQTQPDRTTQDAEFVGFLRWIYFRGPQTNSCDI